MIITPLFPPHPIYVRIQEASGLEAQRLATRFIQQCRQTWHTVPKSPSYHLLRYWRTSLEAVTTDPAFKYLTPEVQKHLCSALIRIDLVENLRGIMSIHGEAHWLVEEPHFAFGECINRGQQIRFWAPALRAMPDDAMRVVILYELASALGWACGNGFNYVSIQETLEDWEVDQTPLETWCAGPKCEALLRAHGHWIEGACPSGVPDADLALREPSAPDSFPF